VIGTRTEECIRAGVIFGAWPAIDGIVRPHPGEWPTPIVPQVLATGGLARRARAALRRRSIRVEPVLTLEGLRIAHELLRPPGARSPAAAE
jgi:pantothenate kinase type III